MDWMLDEWLKLGFEPQQRGEIVLVDADGIEHTGSLGHDIDEDTGEWHWHIVSQDLDCMFFDENDIQDADAEAARITLKRSV
jgi:hypothetical protein